MDIVSIMGQVNIGLNMLRSKIALRWPWVPHLLLNVGQERVIRNVAERRCVVNRLRNQPQSASTIRFLEGNISI